MKETRINITLQKSILPLLVSQLILLILVVYLARGLSVKVDTAKKWNTNVEICEWKEKEICGKNIPKPVKLFLVGNVKTILETNEPKAVTSGMYRDSDKSIYLLVNNFTQERVDEILTHELAHYQFKNNLSNEDRQDIKVAWKRVCENPNELYAYTTQLYGDFKFR